MPADWAEKWEIVFTPHPRSLFWNLHVFQKHFVSDTSTCLPWPTSLPVCFSLFKSSSCLLNDWDAVQSGRPVSFIHLPIEIQPKFSVIYIWRSYLKLFTKKKNVWLESFPEMFFFSVFGSSVVSHERCQLLVPRTSKCHHLCKCLQCD